MTRPMCILLLCREGCVCCTQRHTYIDGWMDWIGLDWIRIEQNRIDKIRLKLMR